ncbi:hypothetical protein [Niabella ginsengisoli]|uniref:Pectate lyase superfamily protein domain-containing protein n=1 Tax=Niabella ginsengisoli TaxID=522298 RepID=A0ABS9SHJ4_9BACT|nr:hypothetical protein [Niabella ginsengisoli]MCH5597834.1 hypothetical protein [Niabella ginsengisoli]
MKRLLYILLLFLSSYLVSDVNGQVYVAVSGNDYNTGTKEQPKASLNAALRQVREMRRLNDAAINHPIHIIIKDGIYHLSEPLVIRPEDAGTAKSPTYIEAEENAKVILSGGVKIIGWNKLEKSTVEIPTNIKNNIWVANLPDEFDGLPAINNYGSIIPKQLEPDGPMMVQWTVLLVGIKKMKQHRYLNRR